MCGVRCVCVRAVSAAQLPSEYYVNLPRNLPARFKREKAVADKRMKRTGRILGFYLYTTTKITKSKTTGFLMDLFANNVCQ